MKCDEVRSTLNAHVDGELPHAKAKQMDQHLRCCEECSKDYRELDRLVGAIRSGESRYAPPRHLVRRVSDALIEEEDRNIPWPRHPAGLAYGVPALLLGLIIGWAVMAHLDTRQREEGLIQSLASAHVRSLMADHLTDIASSDSHTVRPWFHGRLDFSPPVEDLTHHGYPLIGGRLEYLAGHPAAALVYRHRQHTINLFISPRSARSVDWRAATYQGYHMVHWDDRDLSYWAVSDLNGSDLDRFRGLLEGRASNSTEP